eukprot:1438720-Lingulodinium_polyedra.AAC.1
MLLDQIELEVMEATGYSGPAGQRSRPPQLRLIPLANVARRKSCGRADTARPWVWLLDRAHWLAAGWAHRGRQMVALLSGNSPQFVREAEGLSPF